MIDHHLNITSRVAVKIQNLPDWSIDWSDSTPQCSRQSLGIEDFLPTADDAGILQRRAINFMTRILVKEFSDLKDLRSYTPNKEQVQSVKKAEVVPMMVLFKDEKFITENIDIMSQLMEDANLSGNPEVCL